MRANSQNIALFGATGTAGRAAASALRNAGHAVTALGRSDPKIDDIPFQRSDIAAPDLTELKPHVVVSCLASRTGTPTDSWAVDYAANIALLEAAKTAGAEHFILLSAICVQKPRLAFQHAKLAFEEALQTSGIGFSIVRPTAFFKSLSGQLDRLRDGKPYLMFGDGTLTACTPISDADLGRFIASCVTDPVKHNAILPIGGPGPALTPRDMGAALFEALDLPPKYRRVSPKILTGVARMLDLAGTLSPKLKTKAELARIGHYYATESMLHWNADESRYDATATPQFGTDTLAEYYHALARGELTLERGDHAVF